MRSVLAGLILLVPLQAFPQGRPLGEGPPPVRWQIRRVETTPPTAGAEFRAVATARVAPGWHLYAMDEPEGGPVALEFSSPAAGAATLVSVGAERPFRDAAPGSSGEADYYLGEVSFTLRLRWRGADGVGSLPVVLTVRYQACNDRMCLPPRTESLVLPAIADRRHGPSPRSGSGADASVPGPGPVPR